MSFDVSEKQFNSRLRLGHWLLICVGVFALGAATAAWLAYGPQIFITLADSALGWCF